MISVSRWIRFEKLYSIFLIWELSIYKKQISDHIPSPFISAFSLSSSSSSTSSLSCLSHDLKSFVLYNQQPQYRSKGASSSSSAYARRKNIQLPLLDFSSFYIHSSETNKDENSLTTWITDKSIIHAPIIPLPCSHLPTELCNPILYTEVLHIHIPVHKILMEQLWSEYLIHESPQPPLYGHIVHRSTSASIVQSLSEKKIAEIYSDFDDDFKDTTSSSNTNMNNVKNNWIGSIGVATEILQMYQPREDTGDESSSSSSSSTTTSLLTVATRGSFRFIVKEIIQTFPFVVAMVDEYIDLEKEEDVVDSNGRNSISASTTTHETQSQQQQQQAQSLIPQTLYSLQVFVNQILQSKPKTLTPLEKSILQDMGGIPSSMISDEALVTFQKNQAEELVALYQVFHSSLLDIASTEMERYYAVAIMVAEMAQLDDPILRRDIIVNQRGRIRLEQVYQELLKKVNVYKERIDKGLEMDYFYPWKDSHKHITSSFPITSSSGVMTPSSTKVSTSSTGLSSSSSKDLTDEDKTYNQDLLVGEPTLPSWAKQIKIGTMIEYYWNDEYGWCRGRVMDKPIQILDELIVTVRFDDGEIHRLPFRGDEKARWKPAR